jgi:hypothetical protein
MSDEALAPPRHELSDVGLRFVLVAVAGLVVGLVAMLALAAWLFPGTIGARFVPVHLPHPATPALQANPRADMAAFRREELQRLNSVGWIDKAAGRVHIPIAEAMRKVAAEGIAGWPEGKP